jgi:hypothetical protein
MHALSYVYCTKQWTGSKQMHWSCTTWVWKWPSQTTPPVSRLPQSSFLSPAPSQHKDARRFDPSIPANIGAIENTYDTLTISTTRSPQSLLSKAWRAAMVDATRGFTHGPATMNGANAIAAEPVASRPTAPRA